MVDLAESARAIDLITLCEELDRHKELEAIAMWLTSPACSTACRTGRALSITFRLSADKALLRGLSTRQRGDCARRRAERSAEDILNEAEAAIFQLSETASAAAS